MKETGNPHFVQDTTSAMDCEGNACPPPDYTVVGNDDMECAADAIYKWRASSGNKLMAERCADALNLIASENLYMATLREKRMVFGDVWQVTKSNPVKK